MSGSGISPASGPRPGASDRSAEEIRRDIVTQQQQLAGSMEALRGRVNELTDWRKQVNDHKEQLITGAAVAGFVIGGLVMFSRRRKRR